MEKERNDADESKKETVSENVQHKAELTNEETVLATDEAHESLSETSDPVESDVASVAPSEESTAPDVVEAESTEPLAEVATSEVQVAVQEETPETAPQETIPEKPKIEVESAEVIASGDTSSDESKAEKSVEVVDNEVMEVAVEPKPEETKEVTPSHDVASVDAPVQETVAVAGHEVTKADKISPEQDKPAETPKSGDQFNDVKFEELSKDELIKIAIELVELEDPRRAEGISRDVKNAFDGIFSKERKEALDKFIADGGESADFEYKHDTEAQKFEDYLKIIREKKAKYYHELERQKDSNLEKKNELLEKLRHIVDGEESTTSINTLKALQSEWKSIGPVPGAQNKTLWANYNALIDRFYDNRSIYFELKELDRKKNLDSKQELCVKAEKLDEETNIKEAVKVLNELHEEFKHIGPVPKDDQEELWQRFKAASDKIYVKRKGFVDQLKTELKENMTKKLALGDEATALLSFDSDRINEWNDKTKELLELQKKWESIGGLPRENAKEVNKKFWSAFKGFFANKNQFFKKLESMRDENLDKKEALVTRAEELMESTDWQATAEEFKKLQNQWKEIGPVPEKKRNEVYKKFKAAGDAFFNKRREQNKGADKEFEENLKLKAAICEKLEALAKTNSFDQEEVFKLQDEFGQVGFVPRNAIKKIQKRYDLALESLMKGADMSEMEMGAFKANLSVNKLKGGPNGDRRLDRKEQGVRRRISQLESDLNTWRTNMEFFASSAKADKLKDQVEGRINEGQAELDALKAELRVIRNS